jgi:nucleoside-diphosphate-sugar epimerase
MVLITGAPGWLGTRLVRVMIDGLPGMPELSSKYFEHSIRCLVLKGIDTKALRDIFPKIEFVEGDVRDEASLEPFFEDVEAATLFHLVGIIHPKRVRDFYEINTEGVRNVLNAAIETGVKRAIVVSSNSPAGCNPDNEHLFDENSPYNPYMNYGKSKKLAEDIVDEVYHAGKIETVIIRPCWFYGPDQPPRQTEFFTMIKDGKAPIVGDGDNKRSMSYVDNSCQGLLLADQVEEANGETYWIADRRPYTMNEIVDTVEQLLEDEFGMEVAHKRVRLPGFVSEIALAFDRIIQGIGKYHQKVHVLSEMNKTIACSIAKAEKELGYAPKIELEEGMRRSIQWCLDNGLSI